MDERLQDRGLRTSSNRRLSAAILAWTLCATMVMPASAYDFEPTEAEFSAWPHYCRARYVTTMIGQSTIYAQRMNPAAIAAAESAIGRQSFVHVHHYCAGLAHLARSKFEADPKRRRFELDQARAEMLYSLRNEAGDGPLLTTITVNLALVERERGDLAEARKLLEEAIRYAPADPKLYLGLAILLRRSSNLVEARTVLERGIAAAETEPLELHYNLGLICIELEDFECAVRHAQTAYAKDYPFTGLKDRLVDRGLWQQ